jgi:pilus assembly protein FimV
MRKTTLLRTAPQGIFAVADSLRVASRKLSVSSWMLIGLLGVGSLASLDAHAIALGRLNVLSSIGEPLRAEVEITDLSPAEVSSIRPSLASAEAYKAMGLDYNPDLSSLQFNVQQTPDGRTVLQLNNSQPVTAAFVDVVLEVSWASGKITRDFTLLLTPPKSAASAVPVAPVLPMTAQAAETAGASAVPATEISDSSNQGITVVRGDTLGQLAMQNLPLNVSLDQMLLALLRSNPDAFVASNVNRLKAGAVLAMPTATDASTVPRAVASQTILAQSRDFNAFRLQLASNARPAQVTGSGREATGKVQSKVEEKTPAAPTDDKLTLSKGALKGTSADAPNTEEKLSQARQANDAADRLAELSKNISDLTKLGAAPAASEPAPVNPADTALAAETPPGVATVSAQAEAETMSLIDRLSKNPAALPAAAGFLGLLLAWRFFRLRRHSADRNGDFRSALQGVDSALKEPAESIEPSIDKDPAEPRTLASSSVVTASAPPTKPAVPREPLEDDPLTLAQAEVALGREAAAEAMLRNALKRTPQRLALHIELMDIYIERDDAASFEGLAIEALTITGGQGANWERICKKGRALDPTNPLYQSAATSLTPASPLDKLDFDLELGTDAPAKTEPNSAKVATKTTPRTPS